jgi:hypothetical protein
MPITNEIIKEIDGYVEKMRTCEDNEDYDGLFEVILHYQTYLNGVLSMEKEPVWRTYYFQILNTISNLGRHSKLLKSLKERERDTTFKLNELTDEVRRLKERLDAWESSR